jgi:hypothetical protein
LKKNSLTIPLFRLYINIIFNLASVLHKKSPKLREERQRERERERRERERKREREREREERNM